MSQAAVAHLVANFGDRVLAQADFRGDDEVAVASADWHEVALFLREDDSLCMDHFMDLTAVDHPERDPRFDVLLIVRSSKNGDRVRIRTALPQDQSLVTLTDVWAGTNWAEREVFDMFGIDFQGHPDLRRILMYEEFEGHPLLKDYPIDRAQPLVPYRTVQGVHKLPPFGIEEGQPFARVDWEARLAGGDRQVSPSIALQQGQRQALSDSEAVAMVREKIATKRAEQPGSEE